MAAGENLDGVTSVLEGAAAVPGEVPEIPQQYSVDRINEEFSLIITGGKSLILRENSNAPAWERLQFWQISTFKYWYANRVADWNRNQPVTWADQWLADPRRRQYEGLEFSPAAPGEDCTRDGYYNTWQGFEYRPTKKGSCDKYLTHIYENICAENAVVFDWVIAFFAQMVQCPQERPGVSLVLQGRQGSGKTTIGDIMGKLFSAHYILADSARYLTGQFNAHMANCLLLQCDEGFWAGDKDASGRLKGLITGRMQMIEHKGRDPIALPNYLRLMISSNEAWVVPAGMEERRFCVLRVGNDACQDVKYFEAIYAEMEDGGYEALLQYLMDFDLSKVDLRAIPETEALLEQKIRGLPPSLAFWFQCLQEGEIMPEGGWPGWIMKSQLHARYVKYCDEISSRAMRLDKAGLFRAISDVVDDPENFKAKQRRTDGGTRQWGYVLPNLQQCRAAFSRRMKTEISWDDFGDSGRY